VITTVSPCLTCSIRALNWFFVWDMEAIFIWPL
jgi:hypothetical protein